MTGHGAPSFSALDLRSFFWGPTSPLVAPGTPPQKRHPKKSLWLRLGPAPKHAGPDARAAREQRTKPAAAALPRKALPEAPRSWKTHPFKASRFAIYIRAQTRMKAKCGRKRTRCADCKTKRKKCEHTSDNATDSDAMVVDTPDTGGDLEWQERGKIDGFGDGIRDFSTGSRKSKVQPVWSYRRCVYSLSPQKSKRAEPSSSKTNPLQSMFTQTARKNCITGLQTEMSTTMEEGGASMMVQQAATSLVDRAVAPVIEELMRKHDKLKRQLAISERMKQQAQSLLAKRAGKELHLACAPACCGSH